MSGQPLTEDPVSVSVAADRSSHWQCSFGQLRVPDVWPLSLDQALFARESRALSVLALVYVEYCDLEPLLVSALSLSGTDD